MKSIKTCLLTVAALLGSISAYAHDFEMDGIYYNITSDATVEVTFRGSYYHSYDEYSGDIIIPSTVTYSRKEYSVTSIGERAFASCTGLTSVTIPNSVTSIGSGAFWICPGLTSVTIPNSVTSIGYEAFRHCSGLTSVTIGNSVTSIGSSAFYGCSGLTSVTIPNSVTSIGKEAFYNCSSLTSVTIPNSVTSIGQEAFAGCSGLTSVTIPNSVTSIGQEVFSNCSGLTSVTIPNSVTSIGESAFAGCSGLTSVTIPNSVTSIVDGAFSGCSGLTSVTIPNSVTNIGESAFAGCSGLTSVTIPNSVTSIEGGAFGGCDGLTEMKVDANNSKYDSRENCNAIIETSSNTLISGCQTTVIPNSVTSIGQEAFVGCSGLTSVIIPNSVTHIGDFAFAGCSGLTSVTIPNSVTSIGEWAFYLSTVLKNVYCYAENVPSTQSSAFSSSPIADATLHVPAASIDSYKATAPWSSFSKIVGLPNEYNLTVSSVGYATLYLDYNAEIPEGVEAYVATEVVDGSLKMKQVEGVLPANTGVIIVAGQGTYTFTESDETPAVIEKNLLKGTVEKKEITAEANTSYYVLSAPDGVVAMYLALLTENKFWNNAHKAYLPISNGDLGIFDDEVDSSVEQLSRRLVFDFGDETGIDEVKTENANVKTAVYDLSGRRVQNAQKGIYIQNGKLMVK